MDRETNQDQQIEIGCDVLSADGDTIGSVVYVVVKPPSLRVTDIVVSTGALLGRDVVVPTAQVRGVVDGKVQIDLDRAGLEQLPDYVEVQYRSPPPTWTPLAGFSYPVETTLWPADMYAAQPSSVEVNAPPGTVALHEGMDVVSSDGEHVGSVDAVETDREGSAVVALVIKQGVLFSHNERVPAELVATVEGDQVTLSITADDLKRRTQQR